MFDKLKLWWKKRIFFIKWKIIRWFHLENQIRFEYLVEKEGLELYDVWTTSEKIRHGDDWELAKRLSKIPNKKRS